jgi:hypothetical protein
MRLSTRPDATLTRGVASDLRKVAVVPTGVGTTRSQFSLVDRVGEGSREALDPSVVGRRVMGIELGERDRDKSRP